MECPIGKNPKWAEFAVSKSFDFALRFLVEGLEKDAAVFSTYEAFSAEQLGID